MGGTVDPVGVRRALPTAALILVLVVAAPARATARETAGPAPTPPAREDPGGVGAALADGEGSATPRRPEGLDAAVASLERVVRERPLDAEAHYRLGLALRSAKRRPESVEHFERAVEIGPATRARLLDLGVAYSDVSRFTEAEAAYRRILSIAPQDADAYHNLANIAVRRGDLTKAVELFRKTIAIDPKYLHAYYVLGHTLKMLGRHDEAHAAYAKVLDLQAKDQREQFARVDSLYQIASIDLTNGDLASAEKRFADVIRAAPDHRGAHWGRAQALLRLGRAEEAKKEIEAHSRITAASPTSGPMGGGP